MTLSPNNPSASRKSQPEAANSGDAPKSLKLTRNSSQESAKKSRVSDATAQKQLQSPDNSDSESSNSSSRTSPSERTSSTQARPNNLAPGVNDATSNVNDAED